MTIIMTQNLYFVLCDDDPIVKTMMIQSHFFSSSAVSFLLDWLPQRLHTNTQHPIPALFLSWSSSQKASYLCFCICICVSVCGESEWEFLPFQRIWFLSIPTLLQLVSTLDMWHPSPHHDADGDDYDGDDYDDDDNDNDDYNDDNYDNDDYNDDNYHDDV